MEPIAYLNGELLPLSQAKIAITDRGFQYGDGLFETLRTYGRRPFLLDAHLERLSQGLSYLRIPLSFDESYLEEAVQQVIGANPGEELYLRITITRGSGGQGLLFPSRVKPTVVIYARPLEAIDHGRDVAVITAQDRRSRLSFLKSLNFLPHLLAREEALERGAFEALLCDEDGLVWEGTVSNFFLVRGKRLITPPAEGRILAGVTRKLVMDLAAELKLECSEVPVKREDLFQANEVFITNSLIEIAPVNSVDGQVVGKESPDTTRALQAKYADFTRNFAQGTP